MNPNLGAAWHGLGGGVEHTAILFHAGTEFSKTLGHLAILCADSVFVKRSLYSSLETIVF